MVQKNRECHKLYPHAGAKGSGNRRTSESPGKETCRAAYAEDSKERELAEGSIS